MFVRIILKKSLIIFRLKRIVRRLRACGKMIFHFFHAFFFYGNESGAKTMRVLILLVLDS